VLSGVEDDAFAQQAEAGAAVHLAFKNLDLGDGAIDGSGALGQGEPGGDGLLVAGEGAQFGLVVGLDGGSATTLAKSTPVKTHRTGASEFAQRSTHSIDNPRVIGDRCACERSEHQYRGHIA
jgi:hypothetical protein